MTNLEIQEKDIVGLSPQVQYKLPPRRTREIPLKRYEPEYEPRQSRYPVANIVKGSFTQETQAFSTTIYSTRIPNTVKEAQKDEKWREAMAAKIKALQQNQTR